MKKKITKRANAIDESIKSMRDEAYYNSETLPGMLDLENEISQLVFGEKGRRIYEAKHYFRNKNWEYGGIADAEVIALEEGCEEISTMIGRELAGTKGERAALKSLKTVNSTKQLMNNIELKDDGLRAELDAVVITRKVIFLIEVKNSGRDMVIDERGNYFRADGTGTFDYNIGEKVNTKERLLRQALASGEGFENRPLNIVNIVAFANSKMQVQNRYEYVQVCHLCQLPHLIDEYVGEDLYTIDDMQNMASAIKNVECLEKYPVEFDFNGFIRDLAIAKAKLDAASRCQKKMQTGRKEKVAAFERLRRWFDGKKPAEAMQ